MNFLAPEEKKLIGEYERLEESNFLKFNRLFYENVISLHRTKSFIPYKNYTKNAEKYIKVEKETFERSINLDKKELKEFINFCIKIDFIKFENQQYLFSDIIDGKGSRVYLINKNIVKLIGDYSCVW